MNEAETRAELIDPKLKVQDSGAGLQRTRGSCRVPRVKLNSCYEENQCGHPFKGHLSRGKSYPKARKRIFSRQYL